MKVALLDPDGIYLGQREIAPEDFDPAAHVDAADYGGDCDLKVGKDLPQYRWNREQKTFEPVHTHQEELARDLRRIIEFAARKSLGTEIEPLMKKHFRREHRLAKRDA